MTAAAPVAVAAGHIYAQLRFRLFEELADRLDRAP